MSFFRSLPRTRETVHESSLIHRRHMFHNHSLFIRGNAQQMPRFLALDMRGWALSIG